MRKYLNYLFVLILFSFIIISGITLFSKGFLLQKQALSERSKCDKYYLDHKHCLSSNNVSFY